MKICSLLPSATEIVFALGLSDQLVGVTHECDFPPEAGRLPVVTRSTLRHGTRDSHEIHHHISAALHRGSSVYLLDQELLRRLDPDLILTQELCDVCAVSYELVEQAVQQLEGKRRVLSLEPTSLPGILATIEQVGEAAGAPARAATLVAELRRRIEVVAENAANATGCPRVFAMEWLDPPFTAGHWVPEMVRLAGGRDTLGREGQPSSQIIWSRTIEYDPEVIVLIPCGFTLEQTVEEAAKAHLPEKWRRLTATKASSDNK
ncbi:MAG: ABC transporter substrate-binding protein [Candidatus Rokuibacteriota bacterium]